MRIFLACPAPPQSLRGNRVTAVRWARLLRGLGYRITIGSEWDGVPCDLMIALHARKSRRAMDDYRRVHPHGPLILCLTGTDLYHDLATSEAARRSLDWADRIVVLQPQALAALRPTWRAKAHVIYQSAPAPAPARAASKSRRHVAICVLAHLRAEKDPLRAALALAHVPADSAVRVTHVGKALSPAWDARAQRLMRRQPRYRWLGEVPRGQARRLLARSHALVVSSRLEGGANVVSEAIVLGVPVLALHIPGNVGLLGEQYPAYYPVGNQRALARLMQRAATDAEFYRGLTEHVQQLQSLFRPERELVLCHS